MTTKSITKQIDITDKESAEKFAEALEMTERFYKKHNPKRSIFSRIQAWWRRRREQRKGWVEL